MNLRNGDIKLLVETLEGQHAIKKDMVVPSSLLEYRGGRLIVKGLDKQDGLSRLLSSVQIQTDDELILDPLDMFDADISARLGIPLPYFKKMRADTDKTLLDANVNWWLRTEKNWFIRAFADSTGNTGIARAMLSDSYKVIDNIDIIFATMSAIQRTGRNVRVDSCDLTDARMYAKFLCAESNTPLGDLIKNYRKARTTHTMLDVPPENMMAGFVVSNSEVGHGALWIAPRPIVRICNNGMIIEHEKQKKVHLGRTMEAGDVQWSSDTVKKQQELITAEIADAVIHFTSQGYIDRFVKRLQGAADEKLDHPTDAINNVVESFGYNDDVKKSLLDAFIEGGDTSAFGVGQAMTWVAQEVATGDLAYQMESDAYTVVRNIAPYDRPSRN